MVLRYRKSSASEVLITENFDSSMQAIDKALCLMRAKKPVWDITLDGTSYTEEHLENAFDAMVETHLAMLKNGE